MTLTQLKQALAAGERFDAFILATDAIVYLVQVRRLYDQVRSIEVPVSLMEAKGRRLVFRSRNAAEQCLARLGFSQVTLVHDSAYGEMIGGPEGGNSQMRHTYPIKSHD